MSSFDLTRISFFIISCNCQGIQLNQILKRLYSNGDKAMNNGIELFVDDKSCMKRPSKGSEGSDFLSIIIIPMKIIMAIVMMAAIWLLMMLMIRVA